MLKKINIPIVMLAADTAMGNSYDSLKNLYRVGPMYFRQWFSYFFAECYEEYKLYCSSGSIKKEKTLKRIEIMEASLTDYFELEETDKAEEPEQDTPLSEEDASPAEESESAAIGDNADCASIAKGTVSYTASAQTEFSEKTEAEKPPEGSTKDTQ